MPGGVTSASCTVSKMTSITPSPHDGTITAEGRFDTVRLLTNPPAIDRLMWMGRHISSSLLVPVKSHSMSIYRKKLASIANDRNRVRGG